MPTIRSSTPRFFLGCFPDTPKAILFFISFVLVQSCVTIQSKADYYASYDNLAESEDWGKCEELLRQAVAEYPGEVSFHTLLNYCLRNLEKHSEALTQIEAAYKRFPSEESVLESYKWSLQQAGWDAVEKDMNDTAFELFERAYSLEPQDQWSINAYGYILREKGRAFESINILQAGTERFPENEYIRSNLVLAYFSAGNILRDNGKLDDAISIFTEARNRFPHEVWFYTYLAEYTQEKGDMPAASQYLIELAELNRKLNIIEREGVNIEVTIYNQMVGIAHKMAARADFTTAFRTLAELDRLFIQKPLLKHLKGVLTFHSGEQGAGMDLVYEAYDDYIAAHPEHSVPVSVELPLSGIYLVGGNDSREAITHAGFNRFCFDFLGSTEDGKLRTRESEDYGQNEDYIGFGKPIYSPVDGTVELVVDDLDDLPPAAAYRLIDGNLISLKDNEGRHYLFIHNKKGSARVSVGQQVKTGQLIAEIGNSGMTTVPHLHFGIYSSDWVVSLPVQFKTYAVLKSDGGKVTVNEGVPATNDIIAH